MLQFRIISFILAILAAIVYLFHWFSPGNCLERSTAKLLNGLERADRAALEDLLAENYADQWGQDRTEAVERAVEASKQFWSLEIRVAGQSVVFDAPLTATQQVRPVLVGKGSAVATEFARRLEQLDQPFTLVWTREAWKPWSWRLQSVRQPELRTLE